MPTKGATTRKTTVKGVAKKLPLNNYLAFITYKGKTKTKTFDTFEEAVAQRKAWEAMVYKPSKTKYICTEYCRDCIYMRPLIDNRDIMSCDYITIKHESRKCPAGDNCTKKVLRDKNYKKKVLDKYRNSLKF